MDSKPLILIAWYGNWPDYLPLFLDGCRRNPEFEVCLLGDSAPPAELPPSVRFSPMPMAELVRRISTATGCEVNIPRPYKLCDVRPAFGLALADHLQGREFWGFGDIDLVWGDLKLFASPRTLQNVDIFCVYKRFVSGAFTLIRNTPVMNEMFLRSPDWKRVFTSAEYFNFDECAKGWGALYYGAPYSELDVAVCSFSEVVFKAVESGEIRGYFETVILDFVQSLVEINERGVFECHTAYALLHFVRAKQRLTFALPKWNEVPPRYFMTAGGLFVTPGGGTLEKLRAVPYAKIARELGSRVRDRLSGLGNRLRRKK